MRTNILARGTHYSSTNRQIALMTVAFQENDVVRCLEWTSWGSLERCRSYNHQTNPKSKDATTHLVIFNRNTWARETKKRQPTFVRPARRAFCITWNMIRLAASFVGTPSPTTQCAHRWSPIKSRSAKTFSMIVSNAEQIVGTFFLLRGCNSMRYGIALLTLGPVKMRTQLFCTLVVLPRRRLPKLVLTCDLIRMVASSCKWAITTKLSSNSVLANCLQSYALRCLRRQPKPSRVREMLVLLIASVWSRDMSLHMASMVLGVAKSTRKGNWDHFWGPMWVLGLEHYNWNRLFAIEKTSWGAEFSNLMMDRSGQTGQAMHCWCDGQLVTCVVEVEFEVVGLFFEGCRILASYIGKFSTPSLPFSPTFKSKLLIESTKQSNNALTHSWKFSSNFKLCCLETTKRRQQRLTATFHVTLATSCLSPNDLTRTHWQKTFGIQDQQTWSNPEWQDSCAKLASCIIARGHFSLTRSLCMKQISMSWAMLWLLGWSLVSLRYGFCKTFLVVRALQLFSVGRPPSAILGTLPKRSLSKQGVFSLAWRQASIRWCTDCCALTLLSSGSCLVFKSLS